MYYMEIDCAHRKPYLHQLFQMHDPMWKNDCCTACYEANIFHIQKETFLQCLQQLPERNGRTVKWKSPRKTIKSIYFSLQDLIKSLIMRLMHFNVLWNSIFFCYFFSVNIPRITIISCLFREVQKIRNSKDNFYLESQN